MRAGATSPARIARQACRIGRKPDRQAAKAYARGGGGSAAALPSIAEAARRIAEAQ